MASRSKQSGRRNFLKFAGMAAAGGSFAAAKSGLGAQALGGPSRGLPKLKITDVRVIVTCPGRNYVMIKILTSEPGLYGVGDAMLNGRELAVATAKGRAKRD